GLHDASGAHVNRVPATGSYSLVGRSRPTWYGTRSRQGISKIRNGDRDEETRVRWSVQNLPLGINGRGCEGRYAAVRLRRPDLLQLRWRTAGSPVCCRGPNAPFDHAV